MAGLSTNPKFTTMRVKNSQGVFVDVGVDYLPQLLDTEVFYEQFGEVLFYDGERWINVQLLLTSGVTTAYDAASRALILSLKDPSLDSGSCMYLGSSTVEGSWRIMRSGNNLSFERLESGYWNVKFSTST